MIGNHYAIANLIRLVRLLSRSIYSTARSCFLGVALNHNILKQESANFCILQRTVPWRLPKFQVIWEKLGEFSGAPGNSLDFLEQLGTPGPVFTPMCVYGLPMYLVKPLSRDKGSGRYTKCICPFHPKESVGQKGQIHCVSGRAPCPEGGTSPDTWAIPKHTSQGKKRCFW